MSEPWPKLPDRVKLLVAVPTYDGRVHGDVMRYVAGLGSLIDHPRIEAVGTDLEVGYPCDRVRNVIVEKARRSGYHFVLMIDDDMKPDVMLGHDADAVPFLPAALDFALAHDGPCFVGAPYCGAPPAQRVLVMRWAEKVPDQADGLGLEMRSYTREEAAVMTGVGRVAALPTGMLLIDLRAVERMPRPWFSYEFGDDAHTTLASTEDIVFTRDADWLGVPQYAAWSSWAGHWKTYLTHRPRVTPVESLPRAVWAAAKAGRIPPPYGG